MRNTPIQSVGAIATLIALLMSTSAWGASVQYNITFDADIGADGTGSFLWDSGTGQMTTFVWDFGSGDTGGVLDSLLASLVTVDTIGELFFEAMTGQDVSVDGVFSNKEFTTIPVGLIGPYPTTEFVLGSINNMFGTPSGYEMNGVNASSGIYSLVAVPIPASIWLFGSALGLLGWMRHRSA